MTDHARGEPMPDPPDGYAACRVHDGEQKLIPLGAAHQITHLVELDEAGSNGGRPTVCGLTRFDHDGQRADLPGWSMGGGVHGPGISQHRCETCWDTARRTATSLDPRRLPDDDSITRCAFEVLEGMDVITKTRLQRLVRCGFVRVARLVEDLQERGVLGEADRDGRMAVIAPDAPF